MTQKLLKIGNEVAVKLPKASLRKLGLKAEGVTFVTLTERKGKVTLAPAPKLSSQDVKVATLTLRLIQRYRKDLEALAHK